MCNTKFVNIFDVTFNTNELINVHKKSALNHKIRLYLLKVFCRKTRLDLDIRK